MTSLQYAIQIHFQFNSIWFERITGMQS